MGVVEGPGWCVPLGRQVTGQELTWDGEVPLLDGQRVPPGEWVWVGPDGVGVPLVVAWPAAPSRAALGGTGPAGPAGAGELPPAARRCRGAGGARRAG